MTAMRYVLARYIPDLLRQEPRNVGVVVSDGDEVAARFLGEAPEGLLDLRRLPRGLFNDTRLYAEWVSYWRGLLVTTPAEHLFDMLFGGSAGAFSMRRGGDIFRPESATAQDVADELFARLVDSKQSDTDSSADTALLPDGLRSRRLAIQIKDTFKALRILEDRRRGGALFAEHPIRVRAPIRGAMEIPHRPTFLQENGRQYVMEQIDFGGKKQELVREHAGYAAYMFEDLRRAPVKLEAPPLDLIAIVNRIARGNFEVQEYGLAALHAVPKLRVVHWDDPAEQKRFLDERVEVANRKG